MSAAVDARVLSGSRYVDQIIRCVSCMEEKATGTMGCLGVSIVNVINLHIRWWMWLLYGTEDAPYKETGSFLSVLQGTGGTHSARFVT